VQVETRGVESAKRPAAKGTPSPLGGVTSCVSMKQDDDTSTGDANLKDTPGVSIFEHPKRPRPRRTDAFAQASRMNEARDGAEAHHTARPVQRGPRTRPGTAMRYGGHAVRSFKAPGQSNEKRDHLLPWLHQVPQRQMQAVPQGQQPPPAGRIRTGSPGSCQQADLGARALRSVTRGGTRIQNGVRALRGSTRRKAGSSRRSTRCRPGHQGTAGIHRPASRDAQHPVIRLGDNGRYRIRCVTSGDGAGGSTWASSARSPSPVARSRDAASSLSPSPPNRRSRS